MPQPVQFIQAIHTACDRLGKVPTARREHYYEEFSEGCQENWRTFCQQTRVPIDIMRAKERLLPRLEKLGFPRWKINRDILPDPEYVDVEEPGEVLTGPEIETESQTIEDPSPPPKYTLTPEQQALYDHCNQIIERGQQTFIAVGSALKTVQEDHLYRAEFTTFDDYCQTKWGFTSRSAYRKIQASEVAHRLTKIVNVSTASQPTDSDTCPQCDTGVTPSVSKQGVDSDTCQKDLHKDALDNLTEKGALALSQLHSNQQASAWKTIVETVSPEKITVEVVQTEINKRKAKARPKKKTDTPKDQKSTSDRQDISPSNYLSTKLTLGKDTFSFEGMPVSEEKTFGKSLPRGAICIVLHKGTAHVFKT